MSGLSLIRRAIAKKVSTLYSYVCGATLSNVSVDVDQYPSPTIPRGFINIEGTGNLQPTGKKVRFPEVANSLEGIVRELPIL
jgi:hypothetical protein